MSDDPKDPAPAAAKPAYLIIKQKHSRWWEVRDPDDDLECLTVYRKGAQGGGSTARRLRRSQTETHGSRGRDHLRLLRCFQAV
jgi:hypothetical protein